MAGGAVFLVQRGRADSLPGITAFQAADMGSRAVLEEMKRIGKGAISRLSGGCSNGSIKGKNSSAVDSQALSDLLKGAKCKVNVISYNNISAKGYLQPSSGEARGFMDVLKKSGISATRRKSKGEDIDAGCGQLRISKL